MPTVLEKTRRATKISTNTTSSIPQDAIKKKTVALKKENTITVKKKTLWDVAEELAKNPLFTIDEKDRDLVYGSNMMTRLLQEEEI